VGTAVHLAPAVRHRLATPNDREFLLGLFADSRPELALLPAAAREEVLRMQFDAQLRSYRSAAPQARDWVLEARNGGEISPVGRCYVAESATEHRLLDLAVSPRWRGRGIGRAVLERLCARAGRADVPLRLTVWHENADALRLYRRLGFAIDDPDAASGPAGYLALRWSAGDVP
jgi:ribosomal protein S18 acetylase RimI-like enzyme